MKQIEPRPDRTWSKYRLQRRLCGLCDQSLWQASRGNCGSIYSDHKDCYWVKRLTEANDAK